MTDQEELKLKHRIALSEEVMLILTHNYVVTPFQKEEEHS